MDPIRSRLDLGERIHTARRRAHANQGDLADALNVSRQLIGKWERGEAVPDVLELIRIAVYTRTSIDWFTEGLITAPPRPVELPQLFDDTTYRKAS